MVKPLDIAGRIFDRLTAIRKVDSDKKGVSRWLFRCECGKEKILYAHNVTRGLTRSCGCLHREATSQANRKHGLSKTRLYKIWCCMVNRCHNPLDPRTKDYGSRGIRVCDNWLNNPKEFIEWALTNGYADGLSIERKDVNGHYSPENCTWATPKQQQRNMRSNHIIDTPAGRMCISNAAEHFGVKTSTLRNRVWNNRPYDDLLVLEVADNG